MSLLKKLFLSFCFCFPFITAQAQYRFDHWTVDDGLPQNSVYGIVQTGDGYLWLATLDGLARFDGVRFAIFNKSNSPGISNNRFVSLFEDAHGDLWAGTEESGIVRFHAGRFSNYGVGEGVSRISWLGGDADGNVLSFLSESRVIHFVDGKFSPFDARANLSETARVASRQNVRAFCPLDESVVFLGCYADGRRLSFSPADGSPDYKLRSAVQDTDGNFWLLTNERELVRIENGKVVRVFNANDGLPKHPLDFITGAKISLVSWDGQDSLWLTDLETMQNELLLKTPAAAPPETDDIYPPFLEGESAFYSSYQDIEGNLWFGTERGGLYRARKQVVTTFSRNEGLTETNVYPIIEDADGTLLVGTTRGLFTLNNGSFTAVKSTENFYVQAIGKDPAGRIVFSDSYDLYVREANRFVPFLKGQTPAPGFIYAIHTDRENQLWIGGDRGLTRFRDGAAATFTTADGLAGNDVKVIVEARAGGLWVGTYGGLSLFKDGKFTSWTESDGLPSRTIRALYEDTHGTLWIGSYDGGLARFKDGKFTHYHSNIGLYNDGAFQILEDERRNFWISSNHGIYRVKRDELNEFADGGRKTITSIAYGKSDGMLNAECNGGRSPGGIKTRDGKLWFPTQDGVVMIDPKEIKINSKPPSVVIESVKIDNLSEPPALAGGRMRDEGGGMRDEFKDRGDLFIPHPSSLIPEEIPPATAGGSDLIIEPHQQNFEINYTALSFINSENLRFKYKLEGLDDEWIDAGTRRTAYYSYVPPGEYTFHVIAANSDGVWNEIGATLKVIVKPPFYRTWIFILACAALVLFIIYAIYRRRIQQLERARAMQEEFSRRLINAHETERRRIAAELHDSIGQSLAMIKNRAVLSAESVTDEVTRKQIDLITAQTTQTIGEVREISYALRPYLLDNLGLTKAIKSLLNKLTETSEITIECEIDEADNLFDGESEISVYRIIQESLSNIIKHAEAATVQVIIKKSERNMTVLISDDGKGFDLNAMSIKEVGEGGFGLLGIAERVKMLGGTQEIESKVGGGTTVLIKIPLPEIKNKWR